MNSSGTSVVLLEDSLMTLRSFTTLTGGPTYQCTSENIWKAAIHNEIKVDGMQLEPNMDKN